MQTPCIDSDYQVQTSAYTRAS